MLQEDTPQQESILEGKNLKESEKNTFDTDIKKEEPLKEKNEDISNLISFYLEYH
jgi:hypothetical protein